MLSLFHKHCLTLFTLLLVGVKIVAQPNNAATEPYKSQIIQINKLMSNGYTGSNLSGVFAYYDAAAICMPEHYPAMYTLPAITNYYTQWLSASTTTKYTRTIYELEIMGEQLLESGVFEHLFAKADSTPVNYTGKYLRLWKITPKGLKILADCWGASTYLNGNVFPPISQLSVGNDRPVIKTSSLVKEIKRRNQLIADLVQQRKGAEHATLFTPDAIYMTYYQPMLIGMDQLRPYFIDHEKPGDGFVDSIAINMGAILPMGNFVFEQGYYKVHWRNNDDSRVIVTGKSINIWKRGKDGTLRMYRQMVNHD